jgi:DNA-3-methyladenine glycosylase II
MGREDFARSTRSLCRRDPAIARLVRATGPCTLGGRPADSNFGSLVRAIMYQQLAGRAAAAIHARYLGLFDGRGHTPEAVLALSDTQLRSAGLSNAKVASVRDLATKATDGTINLRSLARLPDDEIVARLSAVRGIGRWTAEMFLIFQLGRPDVWPVDDLGVRNGFALAHGLAAAPTPRHLEAEGERYRPYRTTAAWYCWRAVHLSRGQV